MVSSCIKVLPPRQAIMLLALAVLRAHPAGGPAAAIIATVTDQHPGRLVARTAIGASRVIAPALGEQLPRIC